MPAELVVVIAVEAVTIDVASSSPHGIVRKSSTFSMNGLVFLLDPVGFGPSTSHVGFVAVPEPAPTRSSVTVTVEVANTGACEQHGSGISMTLAVSEKVPLAMVTVIDVVADNSLLVERPPFESKAYAGSLAVYV